MKRMMFLKKMVAMMAMVFSVAMFAACSDDDNDDPGTGGNEPGGSDSTAVVRVTGVSLDMESLTLYPGQTDTLTAIITPEDAADLTVAWSSSDETLVSVDTAGVVTALAVTEEPVTITVTTNDGGFTATCPVVVTIPDGLQVGDYVYVDGSTSSHYLPVRTDMPVEGVVAYVYAEDEQPEAAVADKGFTQGIVITGRIPQTMTNFCENFSQYAWQQYPNDGDSYPILYLFGQDHKEWGMYAKDMNNGDAINGYANTMICQAWNNDMKATVSVWVGQEGSKEEGYTDIYEERPVVVNAVSPLGNIWTGPSTGTYQDAEGWKQAENGPWGTEYYLPSLGEWMRFAENIDLINASLEAAGFAPIVTEFAGDYNNRTETYLTSTIPTDYSQYEAVMNNDIVYCFDTTTGSFSVSTSTADIRNTLFVFAF